MFWNQASLNNYILVQIIVSLFVCFPRISRIQILNLLMMFFNYVYQRKWIDFDKKIKHEWKAFSLKIWMYRIGRTLKKNLLLRSFTEEIKNN